MNSCNDLTPDSPVGHEMEFVVQRVCMRPEAKGGLDPRELFQMGLLIVRIVRPRLDPDKMFLRHLQTSYRVEPHPQTGSDFICRMIASGRLR